MPVLRNTPLARHPPQPNPRPAYPDPTNPEPARFPSVTVIPIKPPAHRLDAPSKSPSFHSSAPRITLLIPTLNQGDYLEQALCSVLDQGYPNLELIVLDGGSEDDTLDLIRGYEDLITYWTSTWDRGPADALNAGLREATGQIVGVLGGDDLLLPYTLERVAAEFNTPHPEDRPQWIAGAATRIGDLDQLLGELTPELPTSNYHWLTQAEGLLPGVACFYQRDLLDLHGGFDARLSFAYHYELHTRLLLAGHTPTLVQAPLACTREHAGSRHNRQVLHAGVEFIDVAEDCADTLEGPDRFGLWRACDEKRQVYALAQQESLEGSAKAHLWPQLLRRTWWLGSANYRRTLLNQSVEDAAAPLNPTARPSEPARKAA